MKKYFLFLLLCNLVFISRAQYFQTGQDPASIKWRQINTTNFQLIYPDYYEQQAQKLAAIMERVYEYKSPTLQHDPDKISILLHTQTVNSNGLVAWAPKRSEFYTTPHQGIYAQDWLKQLAVHEFRHVVQIDKIDSELPKIIKILLGEQGTVGVFGLYFPWWFIEGDAVATETALTNSGRGRFPSFLMEHKAQLVEKGSYQYDKAYNGSVKDFVPNHYRLGYYLVGETRQKYGSNIWEKVMNRVGSKPFSLNPFNKALKNTIGFNKVQLYNSVFDSLQNIWVQEDQLFYTFRGTILSPQNKYYSNYSSNHWVEDSILISYKTGLNQTPGFVAIDKSGNERKLFKTGIIFDESINYRGDWVAWSEQLPDLRWSHSGESMIRLRNFTDLTKRKVKTEFKAFAPAISPDFKKIITVETDFSSNYYLSVYDIETGKVLRRIQTNNNNYFFSPEWINENGIVVIVLFEEGKRIAKFNLNSGKMDILFNGDLGEIKNLKVVNQQLFFTSSFTGKNGIYVLNLNDNSISQIFEPRFGAESPALSLNAKRITFSDYTANGFRLLEILFQEDSLKPINSLQKYNYSLADKLAEQESGVIDLSVTDSLNYESKKYNKTAHLFNFHSWAPASVDPDTYEITQGVSLMSQNKLGTSLTTLGYEWDMTKKTGNVYAKYTFKGWYPIFEFELNTGKNSSEYYIIEKLEMGGADTTLQRFTWNQTNLRFETRVPFNLSRGKYRRLLQPEFRYNYSLYKHDDSTPEQFFKGSSQSLSYRLYYQQFLRHSTQDVFPDFGFTVEANYYHSPFGDTNLGSMILGQSYLFIPGVLANHGIRIYGGFQDKIPAGNFSFNDVIRYPRGWGQINTKQMQSFAIDYRLPLFYPEWSAGGLAYLKRITASLFADYAHLTGDYYEDGNIAGTYKSDISSYGIELRGDAHFLRFYAPVEIGIRTSYLPEVQVVHFDFLLSIDFNSL